MPKGKSSGQSRGKGKAKRKAATPPPPTPTEPEDTEATEAEPTEAAPEATEEDLRADTPSSVGSVSSEKKAKAKAESHAVCKVRSKRAMFSNGWQKIPVCGTRRTRITRTRARKTGSGKKRQMKLGLMVSIFFYKCLVSSFQRQIAVKNLMN